MLRKIAFAIALTASTYATPTLATENRQVQCLADANYYEARGQGDKGMAAVSHVILNRTKDKRFPSTPCGVVHQRTKTTCQFSWMCTRRTVKDPDEYKKALVVAQKAYYNGLRDNTFGALFFHSRKVKPRWSFQITARIGDHIFYRN